MIEDPLLAAVFPGWLLWSTVVFMGLCVGSFLNVVIHRLPIMMQRQETAWAREALELHPGDEDEDDDTGPYNLVVPRSACPRCGHLIRAWENIPILSWTLLRGRCAHCSNPISARYPTIEALCAALTLVVVWAFGFTPLAAWAVLFTWMLLAAAMIDVDHQLLPDSIVLPLLWIGLLVNLDGTLVPLPDAVIGAMVGYLSLWSVYWAFRLLTGKEGMGYGDFKLMGAMGAWLGWAALPGVVLLASLSGIVGFVILRLLGRAEQDSAMAFGPFIAIAGWLALILPQTPLELFVPL